MEMILEVYDNVAELIYFKIQKLIGIVFIVRGAVNFTRANV